MTIRCHVYFNDVMKRRLVKLNANQEYNLFVGLPWVFLGLQFKMLYVYDDS